MKVKRKVEGMIFEKNHIDKSRVYLEKPERQRSGFS